MKMGEAEPESIEYHPSVANRFLHLHIGRHKTGTTSFQNFLHENLRGFEELGVSLFKTEISLNADTGPINSWAHEIPLSFLRPEFEYILKSLTQDRNLSPEHMGEVIENNLGSDKPHLIASHEALSFIRHRSELLSLKKLTDAARRDVRIYLVLRERESWIKSYRKTIGTFSPLLPDKDSLTYLEEDSWLFDNKNLVDVYESVFGKGSVILINYESSLRTHGDICFSLIDSMQLPTQTRTFQSSTWLNASEAANSGKTGS
jgi:hypothetical protein